VKIISYHILLCILVVGMTLVKKQCDYVTDKV